MKIIFEREGRIGGLEAMSFDARKGMDAHRKDTESAHEER